MAYPNPNVSSSGSTPGPASESPSTPIPILATFDANGNLVQAYGAGGVAISLGSGGGSPPPVNPQTGTTYTLALTDAPAASANQGIVTMNNASANTLTIPANGTVAFPVGSVLQVVQLGAGQTTIAITTDTLLNASSVTARAQNSTLTLTKVATTTWVLSGDNT
jgi:hypothetical protein